MQAKVKFLPVVISVVWLTLSACGQKTFTEMADSMTPEGVEVVHHAGLNLSDSLIILDAREIAEYNVSHLQGARHIGYDNFNLSAVSDIDKHKKIIVYCSVGYRSGEICKQLNSAGYQHVFNLWGGIFDWVNSDKPVYNDEGLTKEIHPYSSSWSKWLEKGEITYE
jgi:rhodanese-related sulfurtransferase